MGRSFKISNNTLFEYKQGVIVNSKNYFEVCIQSFPHIAFLLLSNFILNWTDWPFTRAGLENDFLATLELTLFIIIFLHVFVFILFQLNGNIM